MKVKVPFRFVVGNDVLPAGQYRVHTSTSDPAVVWFFSPDGRHVAHVATEWGGEPFRGPDPNLRFKVYDKVHFLSQIRVPGEGNRTIPLLQNTEQREVARLAKVKSRTRARS